MNALLMTALCAAAALASVMLRRERPEMALMVGIAGGVVVTAAAVGEAGAAFSAIRSAAERMGGMQLISPLVKASGICLVAEFGMDLCEDAGEKALAGRIGLGVRCAVLVMALPMLLEILTCVDELLS